MLELRYQDHTQKLQTHTTIGYHHERLARYYAAIILKYNNKIVIITYFVQNIPKYFQMLTIILKTCNSIFVQLKKTKYHIIFTIF